jgi:hypothetical protein
MTFADKLKRDVVFGNKSEEEVLGRINKFFKGNFTKTEGFKICDYKDKIKRILIELKTRRCKKDQYFDTMIGMNKMNYFNRKIRDKDYKVYLLFRFTDGLYYYDYNGDINPNWIRKGGRTDRGRREIKKYYFIPTELLKEVDDANIPEDSGTEEDANGVPSELGNIQEETPEVEEEGPTN